MIRLYVIIGLAAALAAAAGYAALERGWRKDAQAEVSRLEREVQVQREIAEQARLAREVEAAHRARELVRAAEKQRALEALLTGDFTDADTPIDPRVADFLDCMRRAENGNPADCARGLSGLAPARPDQ